MIQVFMKGNGQMIISKGVQSYSSGDIQVGQWMNDKLHGVMMYIPKNGGQIEIQKYENEEILEILGKTDNVQN
ncbi:UNKNOWN [Stylonychia lemnae]|uniref:Uncharacterized protein n=1 Tax=Stylonychia lemnae TaxID=5949 RepID=A0A078BAX0_STYLE|nr:UNKNOWN [Stylonychia lemnae]|eukprot:CDW90718.1 UNKNOWN [Stylonychia lemnae]